MTQYLIHAKLTPRGFHLAATLTRKSLKGFKLIGTQSVEWPENSRHALAVYASKYWTDNGHIFIKFPSEVKHKNRKARLK